MDPITSLVCTINGRPLRISAVIAYLNNHIFPPLLTEEEEAAYIRSFQLGNMDARNALIEHNLRLVTHICKKFESTGLDKEDLISIGTIGLIKGINTFSPERGARLATYTARCIENEILMQLRASRNQKAEISLHDSVGIDKEGNEVILLEILSSLDEGVDETVENAEEKALLIKALAVLTEKERYVLRRRYGLAGLEAQTQREVAKSLGISRSYVSRIEKKAVGKLLTELKKAE